MEVEIIQVELLSKAVQIKKLSRGEIFGHCRNMVEEVEINVSNFQQYPMVFESLKQQGEEY